MLKEETDPIAIEEIQNKLESLKNELSEYSISSIAATTNNLPSNYDLSTNSETSKYFPEIKYQGSQIDGIKGKESCQFFAMYYYMFSFEANKLNNKDSKVIENCYSPEWGYIQYFHNRDAIIDSLRNFGAVKWDKFEYTGELGDDLSLSDIDEDALLEALKTRLVDYRTFKIDKYFENSINFDDKTFIYNGKSELLNFIKETIYSKKPCYASCCITWNTMRTSSNEFVITQVGMSGDTHALTIVGYDDNFWCDVNGNNKKEKGELGAIKVANSWGTGWGKNGYGWILYDALNKDPQIPANRISGRTTAFYNYLECFNAKAYRPNLIARLEFNFWNPDKTSILWGDVNDIIKKCDNGIRLLENLKTDNVNAVRLYDFSVGVDSIADIDDIIGEHSFVVKVGNNSSSDTDKHFDYIYFKLIDSNKNKVQNNSYYINSNGSYQFNTSLQLGDIDYDKKITNTDAQTVLKIASGINTNPSYLQLLLADYNRDGKVDLRDAQAVNKLVK